jgi:hypothetical protein
VSVVGRAGKIESLTLGLDGTNPRFPRKPSATMLTYRLTAPLRQSGSTTTNSTSLRPASKTNKSNHAQSSPTTARLEDGAALLTCNNAGARRWD